MPERGSDGHLPNHDTLARNDHGGRHPTDAERLALEDIPRGLGDSATGKARGGSDRRGIAPRHPYHQHAPMNILWKNYEH